MEINAGAVYLTNLEAAINEYYYLYISNSNFTN